MSIAIVAVCLITLAVLMFGISRMSAIKKMIAEDQAERDAATQHRSNPVVSVPPLSIAPQTSLPNNRNKMAPGRQFQYSGRTYRVRDDGIAEDASGDLIDYMLFMLIYDELSFIGDWSEPQSYFPDEFAASMTNIYSEAPQNEVPQNEIAPAETPVQSESISTPEPVSSEPSHYSHSDHSSYSSHHDSSPSHDSGSHSSYDSGSSSSYDSGGSSDCGGGGCGCD